MNTNLVKLAIAVVLVILLLFAGKYAGIKAGVNRPVRLPSVSIKTFPMELENWKGKEAPIDEKMFRAVAAEELVSRDYTSLSTGQNMNLHYAVFNEFWRIVPHPPTTCYPANGWTTKETKDIPLTTKDGATATARQAVFEKNGERCLVVFWFQFGDVVLLDTPDLDTARDKYRDDDTWPSVLKVMIQTQADKPDLAKAQMQEFANAVYDVTRKVK
ncbi:MAG TPA: EpsI family protein [Thermoguttaceae bacterium]|nr:EpsI family protein [Thermoguttaceae bacterium]